ncbi:MAG TPA: hypothetical protein VGF31_03435 [Myxococcaceae bacterium]
MSRRVKTGLAVLAIAGITAGVSAASAQQKFSFFGPYGGALCDGGGVVAGTEGDWGVAKIRGTSTVRARVSMTHLDPNTTYYVRLIQGVADCGETNATFTTNSHGKGHAKMSEPAVSTHAYVFVENGPATQFYVTETYVHGT